ncbi:hypothetical protein FA95DRAFT_1557349 [Auriscalpium vulgare]|uniref:Uncharacterized protein n=1 Tax=Auriscalpium vulgare TaxID=40419 RepID=A0ACB8RZ10_9AGAM|nr:hypothetical protein FA95DRAFT_1557349 [Auriscalpium vulgare]
MTTDSRTLQGTPQSPSYIPVISPRPSRSVLPSSLSVPQLGLVPTNRKSSGGSPGQSTSTTTHANSVHSPNSSIPSLRSLRSLLPFSSGKPGSHGGSSSGSFSGPFSGFGSSRRSMTAERKTSGTYSKVEQQEDNSPVISIEATPHRSPAESQRNSPPPPPPEHAPFQPKVQSDADKGPPMIMYTPDAPLSSELSTILESDLSGMSKHLPSIDDSRHSTLDSSPETRADTEWTIPRPLETEASPRMPTKAVMTPDPQDTSALDLSTTHLTAEVMQALKEKPSGGNWLDVPIVHDVSTSRPASEEPGQGGDSSFQLESLDPDLAALLSPNRMAGPLPGLRIPEGLPLPAKTPPPSAKSSFPPRIFMPSHLSTPQLPTSALPPSPNGLSPLSATEFSGSQSSPARTIASASLSRSSLSRAHSFTHKPRISRSVTDRPQRPDRTQGDLSSSRTASDPVLPLDEARRASMDNTYVRRPAPPSPLSAEPAAPPLFPQQPVTDAQRRPVMARLTTTPRRPALYNPAAAARLMRSAGPSTSPNSWDADSVSPSSRAPSSMSMGAPARRLHRARPSADEDLRRPNSSSEASGSQTRQRNRSFSVGVGSREGPSTEWLGPRAAKAFAAAGLLDHDRDANVSGAGSRFATVRSMGEHDYRSQYAPSRAAFSEAGSGSSWRSVSRAMTNSEHGAIFDSVSTTPRTTFSSGSTAPTSVSGASSPQHVQAALQSLQGKHALETGTLLAALADSQRTAQTLRDENAHLSGRVQELEAQLANAQAQLRHPPYAPPPLSRSVLDRVGRPTSSDGRGRRYQPRSQLILGGEMSPQRQSPLLGDDNDENELLSTSHLDSTYRMERKRYSGAESIFTHPASNMSLLLHEDGVPDRSHPGSMRSSSPGSSSRRFSVSHHAPRPSLGSSVGNISPTTASFSMAEMQGSPKSLFLRPEHELHLGDMASLDLRFDGEDDEHGADDGD